MADFYTDHDVAPRLAALLRTMGHDVVTTQQLGRARARDAEQLRIAAQQRRTFITHNGDDFVLLHDAWRVWSGSWQPTPTPEHTGILVMPQSPRLAHEQAAQEIDTLINAGLPLVNELYRWRVGGGWSRSP